MEQCRVTNYYFVDKIIIRSNRCRLAGMNVAWLDYTWLKTKMKKVLNESMKRWNTKLVGGKQKLKNVKAQE